jgi:hypothetical protein
MILSLYAFSRNADIQRYPKTFVWEKFVSWEFFLRTLEYSILNLLYARTTTLGHVLVVIQTSGYNLRNIDALESNLGKVEQTHWKVTTFQWVTVFN